MLFPLLTVVPGLAALVTIPGRMEGNFTMALPLMLIHYYPEGLLGIGVAALLASFMSGMAGNVTAFNTVWTYDIYQAHIAPGRSDRHYLIAGRVVTVAGIVISIATAYTARSFPNVFDYWALLSAIFVGAPFATFILGIATRRVGGTAAFCGMLAGIAVTIAHYFLYELDVLHYGSALAMDFYGAAYGFFANAGVALAVSVIRHEPPRTLPAAAAAPAGHVAWIRTPWALAAAAAALMIALNLWFW
jgi:SSS family solute:Na+ symporter